MKFLCYILIVCCVLQIVGCRNKTRSYYSQVIREWQGKEIQMPNHFNWKFLGKDTICSELLICPYKILVYTDSTGCTPCKFQTSKWKALVDSCQQKQMLLAFIFVFNSHNYGDLDIEFIINDFNYPVIFDIHNEFDRLNHFHKDPIFHTFLLDTNNKVLITGSPITDPNLWKLYEKVISQTP